MSRREDRDSESKRHRSRFDREPSPKKHRRDGKPETERSHSNRNLDSGDHSDRDQKHRRRRLQDALPLEAPLAVDPKVEVGVVTKESDDAPNGHRDKARHPSIPTEEPRSRSYFQHDERGNAGQSGRSHSRREASDHGWRDSKNQLSEKESNKGAISSTQQRDVRARNEDRAWRHDGFFEMEADPKPPARKRPAFREQKVPVDSQSVEKTDAVPLKSSRTDRPDPGSEKGQVREGHTTRHSDRPEKPLVRDRDSNRSESQRVNFPPRHKYANASSYRGTDRFIGRQGHHRSGIRVEKWKHDLFDEANKSPTTKNEEDQIAKVEALLSS